MDCKNSNADDIISNVASTNTAIFNNHIINNTNVVNNWIVSLKEDELSSNNGMPSNGMLNSENKIFNN